MYPFNESKTRLYNNMSYNTTPISERSWSNGIHKKHILGCLVSVALALAAGDRAAAAERVRLPAVADIGVSSVSVGGVDERRLSWGQHETFKLKSVQEMGVVRFDATAAVGRRVVEARLHLHRAGDDRLRWIRVSTVNGDWEEGTTHVAYGPPSGACYDFADWGSRRPWSWVGSQLCDVIMGSGNTLHHWAACREGEEGWVSLPLPPALIYALCIGDSDGLALQDGGDPGLYNNHIHAVQSGGTAPYIEVVLAESLVGAPAVPVVTAEPVVDAPRLEPRSARITIAEATGVSCWRMALDGDPVPRWRVPHPAADGPTVFLLDGLDAGATHRLTVRAVAPSGAESPAATVALAVPPLAGPLPRLASIARPEGDAPAMELQGGSMVWAVPPLVKIDPVSGEPMNQDAAPRGAANVVWDGERVALFGCRGEYVSCQIVIQRPAEAPIRGAVTIETLTGPGGRRIDLSEVELYRTWLAKDRSDRWSPSYCIPHASGAAFGIPDTERGLASQRVQSIYLDLYIPTSAAAGAYSGAAVVAVEGGGSARMPIELQVHGFDMPDKLAFWPQLNCYGWSMPAGMSEVEAYRLVHQHRSVLFRRDYQPQVTGSGADLEIDWTTYDRTVGPLLSGEAFAGNRRAGVPIEALALPFWDSWPTPLTPETYAYRGDWGRHQAKDRAEFQRLMEAVINRHYRSAPPIADGLSQGYRDAFIAAQSQFVQHFREQGWDDTELQCLFMGKSTHRIEYGVNMWWTTDEPYHWSDWQALRYFAQLWTANRARDEEDRWVFRADISRPMWQGQVLDGVVDVIHYGTGAVADPADRRRCRDLAQRGGFDLRVYGNPNRDDRSNGETVAWILDAWGLGANAALPWQTMGNDRSLDEGDRSVSGVAMIAPGDRFGVHAVGDLRLKACRDAEQIIEYLTLFARRHGLHRDEVVAVLRRSLGLSGSTEDGAGADDADALRFTNLSAWQISGLRRSLAEAISP